jgi:hypothetical protein
MLCPQIAQMGADRDDQKNGEHTDAETVICAYLRHLRTVLIPWVRYVTPSFAVERLRRGSCDCND